MAHRLIKDGELVLYGPVGFRGFFDEDNGFTDVEVVAALAEMDGDVTVRLNSGGGIAFQGISIHNALRAREDRVTVIVDAIAASAASVIAMAGDDIVMRGGSMMMIHDASGLTFGTRREHEKQAHVLNKIDGQLARIYAGQTGLGADELRRMMDEETWLDGDEAVEKGFATQTEDAQAEEPSAFDYGIYAHAPERLVARSERVMTARMKRVPSNRAAKPMAEESDMDLKNLTAAQLRQERPELVKEIEDKVDTTSIAEAARADGEKAGREAERARIAGIEKLAMKGHEDLIAAMKADGTTTPEQAAVKIIEAAKAAGTEHLASLAAAEKEIAAAGGIASDQTANPPVQPAASVAPEGEDKWRADYQAGKVDGFADEDDYVAFKKAEARGSVKVLRGRDRAA